MALVDEGLMTQLDVKPGDRVSIGATSFEIAGALLKIPGEAALASSVGPRIYISYGDVNQTELLQKGSRVNYRLAIKAPSSFNADTWAESHKEQLESRNMSVDTVAKRRENLGEALDNLFTFLNLIGIAALILGGIGVSSSMYMYAKSKIKVIAVLRCVGATSGQVGSILLGHAAAVALLGTVAGTAMGIGAQHLLPGLIQEFLPMQLETHIEWTAVLRASLASLSLAFAFTVLPFSKVWSTSPIQLLRSGTEVAKRPRSQRWTLLTTVAVVIAVTLAQSPSWGLGISMLAAFAIALGLMSIVAYLVLKLSRSLRSKSLPFSVRQGIANLHRPNNQSLMVLIAVSVVTFAVANHLLVHHNIIGQFQDAASAERPNLILFDIQADQRGAIDALAVENALVPGESIPMVTMRLTHRDGKPLHEAEIPEWALRWEYRASYRAMLRPTETVIEGQWISRFAGGIEGVIPISLESSIAKTLAVGVGDKLSFDVQGIPIHTEIASIREVDWQSMQPNFYVLFPEGVLEDAPQIFIQAMNAPTLEQSAQFQRKLVHDHPNVSAVDLRLLLRTVDDVIQKARTAIQFMAFFFIGAAFLVLVTSLYNTRNERLQESTILRALGAPRSLVTRVLASEYLALAVFSTAMGLVLATLGSYLIVTRLLHMNYQFHVPTALWLACVMISVTVLVGSVSTWGVWRLPVMTVLKSEKDA